MRMRVISAAAVLLAAVPAFAQTPSREVTGPWNLNSRLVACTDLPTATKPIPRLVVKGPHLVDRRSLVIEGLVIVGRQPNDGIEVGQRYMAYRLMGDPKAFPRPGEGFGDLRITGWLSVKAVDDVNALLEIERFCDPIEPGDFLEPFVETGEIPENAAPMAPPDFSDRAEIMFGADNRTLFGHGHMASINRGTVHGVVPGARYALYRDKKNGLPLIHLGEVVVLTTGELTSKVMVTHTFDAVYSGDLAIPRRQP